MKRIFLALAITSMFGSAQAANLVINSPSPITFAGYDGQPEVVTGPKSTGFFGSIFANVAGTFYATYLGNESSYENKFTLKGAGSLTEESYIGKTISTKVNKGLVQFKFSDDHGGVFKNGMTQTPVIGFAILSGDIAAGGHHANDDNDHEHFKLPRNGFDYILGFNDSYKGDADYDDFVVGIKFVAAPVPEASSYSMMLAGLGMIGFVAGRRRNHLA